jgi:hypothetical protein
MTLKHAVKHKASGSTNVFYFILLHPITPHSIVVQILFDSVGEDNAPWFTAVHGPIATIKWGTRRRKVLH